MSGAGQATPRRPWLVLALLVLGIALRAYELGELSLHGDEILTLRNAESALLPRDEQSGDRLWQADWAAKTTPLLQHGTALVFRGLGPTPLAARVLPFLAGVFALCLFPLLARRLWNGSTGLVCLALLATCPRHVEMSRLARYQSLSYLFGGLTVLAVALLLARRRGPWTSLALVSGVLAVAAHPSGLLVAAVSVTVVAAVRWREGDRRLVAGIAVLAAAVGGWFLAQGVPSVVSGGFTVGEAGTSPWRLGAVLTYSTGPLLVLLGCAAGVEALGRRQAVGGFLALAFLAPAVVLAALATFKAVGVRFFGAAEPALLLLAVLGAARLGGERGKRVAIVTGVLVLSQVPLLVSNLVDGQRYDYRGLSAEVLARTTADDVVLGEGHETLDHYLGRSTEELPASVAELEARVAATEGRDVYLAVLRQRGGLVYGSEAGLLEEWLASHAAHLATIGRRRPDDRLYRFEIELHAVRGRSER